MITNMFSTMDSNDLKSLKKYLDDHERKSANTQNPWNTVTAQHRRSFDWTKIEIRFVKLIRTNPLLLWGLVLRRVQIV